MNISDIIIPTVTAIFMLSSSVFAQDDTVTEVSEPTKDTVLVSVNDKDITLGHVLSLASRLPEQYQGIDSKDLYAGIIDQLVQQELLSTLITEETTELRLATENERRALYATEAIEAIYGEVLTDEAIQEQYSTLYEKADPIPEYNASHILVETEEEAIKIAAMLNEDANFAELAKEKSTGPSGPQGGELGWVGLGQLVPEFEGVMVKLEKDEVSEPVKTQFGWHVIKLNDTRDQPVPTLEEVRVELEETIKAAALETRISQLETAGKIIRMESKLDPEVVKKFELLED